MGRPVKRHRGDGGRWRDARGHFARKPTELDVGDALAEAISPAWTGYHLDSGDGESGPRLEGIERSYGQAFESVGAEGEAVSGDDLADGLNRFAETPMALGILAAELVQVVGRFDLEDGSSAWNSLTFGATGETALGQAGGRIKIITERGPSRPAGKQGLQIEGWVGLEIRYFTAGRIAPTERKWKVNRKTKPKKGGSKRASAATKSKAGPKVARGSRSGGTRRRPGTRASSTSRVNRTTGKTSTRKGSPRSGTPAARSSGGSTRKAKPGRKKPSPRKK